MFWVPLIHFEKLKAVHSTGLEYRSDFRANKAIYTPAYIRIIKL